jgi:hypothetical protein
MTVTNAAQAGQGFSEKTSQEKQRLIYCEQRVVLDLFQSKNKLRRMAGAYSLGRISYQILELILERCERVKTTVPTLKGPRPYLVDVTTARWDSKATLAELFGTTEKQISKDEKKLRDQNLLVSTGQKGHKVRQFALGQTAIAYLMTNGDVPIPNVIPPIGGISNTPNRGYLTSVVIPPIGGDIVRETMSKRIRVREPLKTNSNFSENKTKTNTRIPFKAFNPITGYMEYRKKNRLLKPVFDKFGVQDTLDRIRTLESAGIVFSDMPDEPKGTTVRPWAELMSTFESLGII